MTRLLHFGDLHLGAGPDYGRMPTDRLADQTVAWERVLDMADELDVDAIVGGGDTFHGPLVTPEQYDAFQAPIRARRPGRPVIMVTGNGKHDAAMRAVTAPQVVGDVCEIYTQPTVRKVGDVSLVLLPWCPVARLVAAADGGDRREIHREAAEKLITIARGIRAQLTGPTVLVPHWSISGAATPTGAMTDSFHEVVLPLQELRTLGFDAVVASHIHKHQVLSETPWIGYTSSTTVVDFGEADTPHGVVLLDIDEKIRPNHVHAEFLPIDGRPFITLDVDFTDGCDFSQLMEGYGDWSRIDDAIVKVRYRATEEQARFIDVNAVRQRLLDLGAHNVYKVEADIVREARVRVAEISEELAPLDAVELWCETQKLEGWERRSIEALTEKYLEAVGA